MSAADPIEAREDEITEEDATYLDEYWFQWGVVEDLAQSLMAEVTFEAVEDALKTIRQRFSLGGALLVERRGDWDSDADTVEIMVRHAAVSGPTQDELPFGPQKLRQGQGLLGDVWKRGGAWGYEDLQRACPIGSGRLM